MNQQAIAKLKQDFREWSGGFPPESREQIAVYLDYVFASTTLEERLIARQTLWQWMNAKAI